MNVEFQYVLNIILKIKKNWIEIKEEMKSILTINVSHQMQWPKEC